MNFKSLSNQELLTNAKSKVQVEKALTYEVLLYLREVENRSLHLETGYSSMFAFCTEFLQYSEPEAQIRIQAMRLIKSVPIAEEKIKSGELSLTVAANVQGHFNKENIRRKQDGLKALSFTEKLDVVQKVQNLSVRSSEKALAAEFPEASLPKDKIKPLTSDKTKFEFMANSSLNEKLKKLQNKLAHKNPYNNLGELVEILADMALEEIEAKEKLAAKKADTVPHGARQVSTNNGLTNKQHLKAKNEKYFYTKSRRKYISIKTKRMIYQNSNNQCCYIDKDTNTKCTSQYALEIDHIMPLALGGSDDIQNLRLLCRPHNQYLAKRI